MKFFSNLWKYLTLLFAEIIAGIVAAIKLIEKPSVLNVETDTFIAQQTQKIGKLKQRVKEIPRMLLSFLKSQPEKKKDLPVGLQDANCD